MPPHGRRRLGQPRGVLLLLLACLISAASAASSVLGIDLGTEYFKAVLVKPGIPLEIVLTKDSKRKEAAALGFKPGSSLASSTEKNLPERLYGGDALAVAARFPRDVFSNLKPLLGLDSLDASPAQSFTRRYPGNVLQKCPTRGAVCFKSDSFTPTEDSFSVEELLAMELQNIRTNAEAFAGAGSTVRDAVITVPVYYSTLEKQAVVMAAELAGLNVLALTTDGLAVGLHYATTRTFPVIKEGIKPEYHLIYDMGAGSTTATVLRFQGRSIKDVGRFNKTIQEVQVVGAGWNRELGGDALNSLILDDMISQLAEVKQIQSLGATIDDIRRNGRTVAKLWKEAERMRQVLSANIETQSSFEGIYHEDVNFRYKISRDSFEKMAASFVEQVKEPLNQALSMAHLDLTELESIIVHGGAVRTPFVQKALEAAAGSSDKLKNNVNSDEAAAFGAAFKAAGLSPSFRVKEIQTSEAAIWPATISIQTQGSKKEHKLFNARASAADEKELPLKFLADFSFGLVQHADGKALPVSSVQTLNLSSSVENLKEKHGCEPAAVNTSLVLRLSPVDGLPEVSRLSISCEVDSSKKAGVVDGVKGLFGFGKKDDQEVLKDSSTSTSKSSSKKASSSSKESSTSTSSSSGAKASASGAKDEAKLPSKKVLTIPIGLTVSQSSTEQAKSSDLARIAARMKLFDASDSNRKQREEALNGLEGYTYRIRDLLEDAEFVKASREADRNSISSKASAASEWIYGDGADAATEAFQARMKELQALVEPIQRRKTEAAGRPEAISALRAAVDTTKSLLETLRASAVQAAVAAAEAASSASASASEAAEAAASNAASEDTGASDDAETETAGTESSTTTSSSTTSSSASEPTFVAPVASEEDMNRLQTLASEVETWLSAKIAAQDKLEPTAEPVLLVKDLGAKREEVQRLIYQVMAKQAAAPKAGSGSKKQPPKDRVRSKSASKAKTATTDTASSAKTSSASEAADASATASPAAAEAEAEAKSPSGSEQPETPPVGKEGIKDEL